MGCVEQSSNWRISRTFSTLFAVLLSAVVTEVASACGYDPCIPPPTPAWPVGGFIVSVIAMAITIHFCLRIVRRAWIDALALIAFAFLLYAARPSHLAKTFQKALSHCCPELSKYYLREVEIQVQHDKISVCVISLLVVAQVWFVLRRKVEETLIRTPAQG
jgi:branched-subunit amino acid ABC-type transport system permease component